jgi:serine protease inhibitor
MKERTVFCLLQILILTCANPANHLRKRQADVDLDLVEKIPFTLSKGLNKFNHDLFPKLTAVNDGNIVISPFSLHTALSMTLIGSPADSNTHKQLSRALFDEEILDKEAAQLRHNVAFLDLSVANSLFHSISQ